MDVTTRKVPRKDLEQFIPNLRSIIAFENMQQDIATSGDILSTGQFVVLTANDQLGAERVLTGSGNVSVTDGGAGEDVTLDLTDTGLAADTYGDAQSTLQIQYDEKGRAIAVLAIPLNTDNITEGLTNLFFTIARARQALSGAGQINYDNTTGIIRTQGFSGTISFPVTSIDVNEGSITGYTP